MGSFVIYFLRVSRRGLAPLNPPHEMCRSDRGEAIVIINASSWWWCIFGFNHSKALMHMSSVDTQYNLIAFMVTV